MKSDHHDFICESYIDIQKELYLKVNRAIDDELITMCSCAAAGVPISSMSVVHAMPKPNINEPLTHDVFLSINGLGLNLIRGRAHRIYQM